MEIILGQGAGKELDGRLNLHSAVAVLLELNRGQRQPSESDACLLENELLERVLIQFEVSQARRDFRKLKNVA